MNMPGVPPSQSQEMEMLEGAVLTVEDLARACGATESWVLSHVEDGLIDAHGRHGEWRFDSVSLVRARRVALLEQVYGADPQLAALTISLIEEVTILRKARG